MKSIELIKTLEKLRKPFYTIADLEKLTGLTRKSLYVMTNRLVSMDILKRIGPGIYRLFSEPLSIEKTAAEFYMPNYLSFESALSRYGVLNLIPYSITFATTRKTKRVSIEGREVEFRQIKKNLFWGYEMSGGIYIAKPEKAFLDLIYLASRGKASIDWDELDMKKISTRKTRELLKIFPEYTKKFLKNFKKNLDKL